MQIPLQFAVGPFQGADTEDPKNSTVKPDRG